MNSSVALVLLLLVLLACKSSQLSNRSTVSSPAPTIRRDPPPVKAPEPADTEVSNPAQRLARAAALRAFFRENEQDVNVVATGKTLSLWYKRGLADYFVEIFDTFCRQGHAPGLMVSGFETIEIQTEDSFGKMQRRSFPITDCKNIKPIE